MLGLFVSVNSIATQENKDLSEFLYVMRHDRVLAELSLPSDGEFIVTYVHSIHKRPVFEYYRAEKGQLHLYELRYDTSSTGMPSDSEGGYRLENGFFVLSMNRWFPVLPLFVSPIPGHGVIIRGHLYRFTEWAPEEELLELSVSGLEAPRNFTK